VPGVARAVAINGTCVLVIVLASQPAWWGEQLATNKPGCQTPHVFWRALGQSTHAEQDALILYVLILYASYFYNWELPLLKHDGMKVEMQENSAPGRGEGTAIPMVEDDNYFDDGRASTAATPAMYRGGPRPPLPPTQVYAWAVALAAATAIMARTYSAALQGLVQLVWVILPNALGAACGPWLTVAVCGGGGALVGFLGPTLPKGYGVGEWVLDTTTTSADGNPYPGLSSLPTVLVVTLLTSSAGFSLGPEGPMVCAGGLLGAALARRLNDDDHGSASAAPAAAGAGGTAERRHLATVLSVAGAAGALSAFLGGMPLVGAVFATELLGPTVAIVDPAPAGPATTAAAAAARLRPASAASGSIVAGEASAFSAAVCASIVAALVASAVAGQSKLGGDFDYALSTVSTALLTWHSALSARRKGAQTHLC